MVQKIKNRVVSKVLSDPRQLVFLVGAETFFFGFALGAIINLYLLWAGSPLVLQYRGTLTFKSAIFGDGMLLPLVNMVIASFLLTHKTHIKRKYIKTSLFSGFFLTLFFYVVQAKYGLVNWSMTRPWHWNFLGALHAFYMFSAISFIVLFYIMARNIEKRFQANVLEKKIVSLGILIFILLLIADYDFFSHLESILAFVKISFMTLRTV